LHKKELESFEVRLHLFTKPFLPLEPVLRISGITKHYGALRALSGVSFNVPRGSVFGILGPNGSGKTTLLGIVLNTLTADSGEYEWLGNPDAATARKKMGALLETPNFYHYLSAWDNLAINARIKGRGLDDRERVLRLTGLYERRDSAFQTFSLGMKQRLAIANALLGQPEVVVLDEPTNGLDPSGIAEIRELIRALSKEGYTIIMASHLLDEVEKVCTHMAILKKGQLLVSGAVSEVLRKEDELELATDVPEQAMALLQGVSGIGNLRRDGTMVRLALLDGSRNAQSINRLCAENGIYLSHLVQKAQSLESRFMELTEQ
jgi:ABC-2 type transport system ATP-binding protein